MMYKIGSWERVAALRDNLERELQRAALRCLKMWADKAASLAKAHINNQDIAWVPLSPRYLLDKMQGGYSLDIYRRKGAYVRNIKSWTEGGTFTEKNMVGYAGLPEGTVNDDGEDLPEIAKILEYGSVWKGIPARPLWEPVYEEVATWIGVTEEGHPDKVFLEYIKKYML